MNYNCRASYGLGGEKAVKAMQDIACIGLFLFYQCIQLSTQHNTPTFHRLSRAYYSLE